MTRVTYLPPLRADPTAVYQRYYLIGLDAAASLRIGSEPALCRLIPHLPLEVKVLSHYQRALAKLGGKPPAPNSGLTGRYVAELGGKSIRFAVDARDSSPIQDDDVLEWSDVYFKANRWPSAEYDPKVLPIVNGNGVLTPRRIEFLRSLRRHEKGIDFAFISAIWGGREHNVRLFEHLARLECSKELLAIFPAGSDERENRSFAARLEPAGVPCASSRMTPRKLWRKLARARVVMVRPGMHLCHPWRVLDLLCMGACIVYDSVPPPRWPVPLEEGVHYVDCGLERPDDGAPAPDERYGRLVPTVAGLLADPERMARLRGNAARYFDEHAAPEKVAAYLLATLRARAGA